MFFTCIYLSISSVSSLACIGKKGVELGYVGTLEEKVISEILAVYISERTGYEVKLREFSSYKSLMTAIREGKTALVVGCLSYGLNGFVTPENIEMSERIVYQNLRIKFIKADKLILLPPLKEYVNSNIVLGQNNPAIIIKEKVSVKYPVLCRLLRNLSHRIKYSDIKKLMSHNEPLKKTVWKYLDKKGLI